MKSKTVNLLLILFGIALMVAPIIATSLEVLPSSPYIPSNYYSKGIIDYVNPKTGNYYLAIMPKTESGATLTGAQLRLRTSTDDISIPIPLRQIVERTAEYDWYQYWYETDVVSDGLNFDVNYTITWTVFDEHDRTASVSDWLLFEPLEQVIPEGYFLFNGEQFVGETIVLESPSIAISFVPTANNDAVTGVSVEIYKDGEHIDTIPTTDIPDYYPRFEQQEDGTWSASYVLSSDGSYLFECYVQTSVRNLKLESAALNLDIGYDSPYWVLSISGAAVTAFGFFRWRREE